MTRHRVVRALVGVVAVVLMSGSALPAPPIAARTPIDGIWEYINPGMSGQSFFFDGRYVHFSTRVDPASPPAGALPDSVRARLYTGLTLDAGTFSVTDSIVTAKREYSKDPRQVGVTWRWSFSLKGDTCTYHVLDASGRATATGRAVRVRTRQ